MLCFEFVNADGSFSVPSKCDHTSVLCVPTTLRLSCDTSSQLGIQDALSPTQMPPKKRHRRSASVPGGTRSESRIQRYFARHRQSSGLPHPVPIHADATGIIRTPAVASQPIVPFGSKDVRQNTTSQPAFHFSGSSLSHNSNSLTKLPLSSFSSMWIPLPRQLSSECKVESVENPSASSLWHAAVIRKKHIEESTDTSSLQHGQRMTRCHSQPGALLTRSSSLKRRCGEYRPWLDFRKMREVITICVSFVVVYSVTSQVSDFVLRNLGNTHSEQQGEV